MKDRRTAHLHGNRGHFLLERRKRKSDRRRHRGITRFLFIGVGNIWSRLMARFSHG
jgi:hypothetical protein